MSYYTPTPGLHEREGELAFGEVLFDHLPFGAGHDTNSSRIPGVTQDSRDNADGSVDVYVWDGAKFVFEFTKPARGGAAGPRPPAYGDTQLSIASGTYGLHSWDGSQWVLVPGGARDPGGGSLPPTGDSRDQNNDGIDDVSNLPRQNGISVIPGANNTFWYLGTQVHRDGSPLSPSEIAAPDTKGENATIGTQESRYEPGKGYGRYQWDGKQWVFLFSQELPGQPTPPRASTTNSSGGGGGGSSGGGGGGGGTNTTVHEGGFNNTSTSISELGPTQIAENALERADRAAENEKNRALQLFNQKVQYELGRARNEIEYQNTQRQAAKDYAELVSSPDPGAFVRFLVEQGNIQGGLANSADGALSTGSLAPGAQALQTAERPFSQPTWAEIMAGSGYSGGGGFGTPPAVGGGGAPGTGGAGGATTPPPPAATPPPASQGGTEPGDATRTPSPAQPYGNSNPYAYLSDGSLPPVDSAPPFRSAPTSIDYGNDNRTVKAPLPLADQLMALDPATRAKVLATTTNPEVKKILAPPQGYLPGITREANGTGPGFTRNQMMITGDAPMSQRPDAGGARPEFIGNPTGAPIEVMDYETAKARGFLRNAPRFALGTGYTSYGGGVYSNTVTAAEQAAANARWAASQTAVEAAPPPPAPFYPPAYTAPMYTPPPAPTISTPPPVVAAAPSASASGQTTTSRPVTTAPAPTTTAAAVAAAPPIVPAAEPNPPPPPPVAPTLSTPPVVAAPPPPPSMGGIYQTPGIGNLGIPDEYMQRVLAERRAAQERLRQLPSNVNFLDLSYGGLDPTLRAQYEREMQTGYNIPEASTRAAYQRYAPTGFTRRNFQVYS